MRPETQINRSSLLGLPVPHQPAIEVAFRDSLFLCQVLSSAERTKQILALPACIYAGSAPPHVIVCTVT